ncbi:MAG TPA: carboxypeptidase-like regulatory domain-containing protein, partial [Longimicrobium sp.]|nr:carboxypeptidase-like regulatory domain-containing protein [Longimicrobium sp.]
AVRITVLDDATGAPVAGALVRVQDAAGTLARAGFADRRGTIQLRVQEPGRYVVRAERAGYAPAETLVLFAQGAPPAAELRMRAAPVGLDTVRVALVVGREVGSQTFERRRVEGQGIYLDSAYVSQARATWPGELLESVPGIDIRTAHGRMGWRQPSTQMGRRCLNVLVNGLPYYGGWPRALMLEETLRRTDVVAIEVYRTFQEVPRELHRYARNPRPCGLIVYWTEDGWQSESRGDGSARP